MSERIIIHPFSSTLYRWSYDYHNVVNDMIDNHPGIQYFAVKYKNACLSFELIVKAHIAHKNHKNSPEELEELLRHSYGHSLNKLLKYAENTIELHISDSDREKVNLINSYYSVHMFRYPPIDYTKVKLNHQELMDAINVLRRITSALLVAVHIQTKGFEIGRESLPY